MPSYPTIHPHATLSRLARMPLASIQRARMPRARIPCANIQRHFPNVHNRQPSPPLWLLSDDRIPAWEKALESLPTNSGVIFRHYSMPRRHDYARRMATYARRHRLHFHCAARADDESLIPVIACRGWHVGGKALRFPALYRWGLARRNHRGWLSVAVHNADEWRRARKFRADYILLSPIFATESHRGKAGQRYALLQTMRRMRPRNGESVIALGGMTGKNARHLPTGRFNALAAIRSLIP